MHCTYMPEGRNFASQVQKMGLPATTPSATIETAGENLGACRRYWMAYKRWLYVAYLC